MAFRDVLLRKFRIGLPVIHIQADDDRPIWSEITWAAVEYRKLAKEKGMDILNNFYVWNFVEGFIAVNDSGAIIGDEPLTTPGSLEEALAFAKKKAKEGYSDLFIFQDLDDFFQDFPQLRHYVKKIARDFEDLKKTRCLVVSTGRMIDLPPLIKKDVFVLQYDLPDEHAIRSVVDAMTSTQVVSEESKAAATDALRGLTEVEVKNAIAETIVEKKPLDIEMLHDYKAASIASDGLLQYTKTQVGIQDIGGLDNLKAWVNRRKYAFSKGAKDFGLPSPKGVLIAGVQGCLRGDTEIYDPVTRISERVDKRYQSGSVFHVLAFSPYGPVIAEAEPVKKYLDCRMIEFETDSGYKIAVTPDHRFWSGTSWIRAAEVFSQIDGGESFRLPSILGVFPSDPQKDDRRWSRTGTDSPICCPHDSHSYGERPRYQTRVALDARTLSSGVLGRSHAYLTSGLRGKISKRSLICQSVFLRSKRRFSFLYGSRVLQIYAKNHTPYPVRFQKSSLSRSETCPLRISGVLPYLVRESTQFSPASYDGGKPQRSYSYSPYESGSVCRNQPRPSSHDGMWYEEASRFGLSSCRICKDEQPLVFSLVSISALSSLPSGFTNTRYTRIVKAVYVESEPYYDFHVPVFENYFAAGMWHHNTGKSLTANAIANILQRPLLKFDIGRAFGSLVGKSEENVRMALKIAERMAPSVLYIDEIEKALSGMSSSGETDGGTTARVLATLLSWFQDKTAPVFVVATANDVTSLPAEVIRKGRFDCLFFVDLPNPVERAQILRIHLKKRGRNPFEDFFEEQIVSATKGFTGAEIEQCVIDGLYAAYEDREISGNQSRDLTPEDVLGAIKTTVPLSVTMAEKVDKLRNWAKDRAVFASSEISASDEKVSKKKPSKVRTVV